MYNAKYDCMQIKYNLNPIEVAKSKSHLAIKFAKEENYDNSQLYSVISPHLV